MSSSVISRSVLRLGIAVVAFGFTACSLVKRAQPAGQRTASRTTAGKPAASTPAVAADLRDGARVSYNSCKVTAPYLALTFDDGPHPSNTPRLLGILRERNVKATFFLIGTSVDAHPEVVRMILADGHEVANHTRTHATLSRLSDAGVEREIVSCANSIAAATGGYKAKVFRPPYGAITARQKEMIRRDFGYPSIMWSVDPLDWKRPGVSVVAQRLISGAHPGAIMLAHDLHAPTVDAVPQVLDTLLARGFQFVTVSQLINLEQSGSAPALAMNFGAGHL